MSVNRTVLVEDVDGNEKPINYKVWWETHPEYRDIPVSRLKKMFDFSRDETVPDITIVRIESDLENFDKDVVRHCIKENEGIIDDKDIVFE